MPQIVNAPSLLSPVYRYAHRLMSIILLLLLLSCLALAPLHDRWSAAIVIGLPACAVPLLAMRLWPDALTSRVLAALGLMIFTMLQIHLLSGLIEAHFMIFILISVLLAYRDWRPILCAALAIAGHHLLLGWWQSRGGPVYVMPAHHVMQSWLSMVLTHAAYLVLHTLVLIAMARMMRREAVAAQELGGLSARIARHGNRFDLGGDDRSMISSLGEAFNHTLAAVRATLTDVRNSIGTIVTTSDRITEGNQQLSARSQRQSRAMAEIVTTLEQLSGRIHHNARHADTASDDAQQACTRMQRGRERTDRLGQVMNDMRDSAGRIAEITSMIDTIAFQTNILALNAAVEAARAGDSGRGFSVVAAEVGALAGKSAEASREIAALVEETRTRIQEGHDCTVEVHASMEEIGTGIESVAELMQHIRHGSDEQRQDVNRVNTAMSDIHDDIHHNMTLVNTFGEDVDALRQQTARVDRALSVFILHRAEHGAGRDTVDQAPSDATDDRETMSWNNAMPPADGLLR
ncbi:methyl-accepting chemotaxis protein [Kushneria sp. AK178]